MLRRLVPSKLLALALLVPVFVAPPPTPLSAQEGEGDPGAEWVDFERFDDEISVEVVELSVWVTDRQGDPVTGLSRDDFVLYEDGEPVEITNFSAYEGSLSARSRERALDGADEDGVAPEITLEPAPEAASETGAGAPTDRGAPTGSAEPVAGRTEPMPAEIPEDDRLHLAVLVDNRNIRPADRARVFRALREFLAEALDAGDRVAVASHAESLRLVQRFTEEPADVVRALERIQESSTPVGLQYESTRRLALKEMEHVMREALRDAARLNLPDPCRLAISELKGAAQNFASFVEGHVQGSASGIATLSQTLAGVPGQKVILYVGNGLAQTPGLLLFQYASELCPHHGSLLQGFQQQWNMSWLYEEVASHANAAGVTLYTLDAQPPGFDLGLDSGGGGIGHRPRGATHDAPDSSGSGSGRGRAALADSREGSKRPSSTPRFRPSTHAQRIEDQDDESSLVVMARQTGGRAFLNAGDFSGDFRRLAADMRNYYSLGFAPRESGDGRLHRLKVELKDGDGYRVRHRLRYRRKPVEEQMAERVRGVAQFGIGANPLDARIEIGGSFPAEEDAFRIPVRVWVPLEQVTLLDPEGGGERLRGRLRLLMATTDAGGSLQPVRQKVVPLEVGRPEGAESPSGEHLVEVELTLPAGDHHVALAVRDDLGGETSYLRERFRVPTPAVQARSE